MGQQLINIGAAADDGTGDTLRAGGAKVNANFTELYAANAAVLAAVAGYGPGLTLPVATRAIMAGAATAGPAYLTESGREGAFVFDSSDRSAEVTADPAQGIYVPPLSDTTGASGAWVRQFSGYHDVRWFGAKGDSNISASTGTDDTAAIQAALDYVNYLGGGDVFLPPLYSKIAGPLQVYANTRVTGHGKTGSYIVCSHVGATGATAGDTLRNGSAFYTLSPINGATRMSVTIENVGIINTNASSNGAAYYDTCGHIIDFRRCYVKGFKFGVVYDQTEIAHIEDNTIELQTAGGAAIWLVNGADLDPSAEAGFTNQIVVARNQINPGTTAYGVLDDGGVTHSFIDNDYNTGINALRLAGVNEGLVIANGEFEGQVDNIIEIGATTLSGNGVGGCFGVLSGGTFSAGTGNSSIHCTAASGLTVAGACFSNKDTTNAITGTSGFSYLTALGAINNTGEALCDGSATVHFDSSLEAQVGSATATTRTAQKNDLGKVIRCSAASAITMTIPLDSSIGIVDTGKRLIYEQTGAGTITLTPASGVTLHGDLATNAQWQRLVGYEMAANNWTFVRLGGALTAGSPAAASITTTAGGVGYATGAGGTATQATSRTTGVTLNKLSGKITLVSATTTAGQLSSFAFTNSQLGSTDTIEFTQLSGAGFYTVNAKNNGSGTATVNVYTPIAVGTAEAPAFQFNIIKGVQS